MVRLINTVARVLRGALYGGSPTRDPGQNFPCRRFVASRDRDRLEQQLTENFHRVGGGGSTFGPVTSSGGIIL